MAQFKHVSPEVVRWNYINLIISFFVLIVYFAFLAAGYDFRENENVFFGFLGAMTISIGWTFCWMCFFTLLENIRRKKQGDHQFISVDKFSSAVSTSYFQSQFLMSFGLVIGLCLLMLGLISSVKTFVLPHLGS